MEQSHRQPLADIRIRDCRTRTVSFPAGCYIMVPPKIEEQ